MSFLNDGTIFGLAPRQIEQTSHAEDPTYVYSFWDLDVGKLRVKVKLNLLVRKSLDELIIGERSHFLFVIIMTNAEILNTMWITSTSSVFSLFIILIEF